MQPADLGSVLALVRHGTLAAAASALAVDGSTVFRTVQRLEKALSQRLFERSRRGYRATELALQLAQHAERIEVELEAARSAVSSGTGAVGGTVRLSTTDTLLGGLVLRALQPLLSAHPLLRLDVQARNELANLTQREADIALRATLKPPPHLVGRHLGPLRAAVCVAAPKPRKLDLASAPWIAVDDALPDHPSVRWRRRNLPQVRPRLVVNSVQSVFDAIAAGLGVGIVPMFLARGRRDVVPLTEPLADCETQLWLLTHPESRHLRRIATVAAALAAAIELQV